MELEYLVNKSKKGDISAFMKLLKEKQELFYKIAFAYTNNSYDAEDCISEAAIRGFEKLGHLKQTEKFYSWFTSLLINTCRSKYRRKEKAASEEELIGIIGEVSYSSVEDKLIIEDLLNMLKEDERELLVLRYLKDYSLKEIASIMDIPVSTVKTKIYRSLNFLRFKNRGLKNEY
jgi:RNA polymerase sigma-70 factor (ECF subfamily)